MSENTEELPDLDLVPAPVDPPPLETVDDMVARHDAEFAAWRAHYAEKWIHCSRCDGFHQVAFVPRAGVCSSARLEPKPMPPLPPPVQEVRHEPPAPRVQDDDEDDEPVASPGPKRNAKKEAEIWRQVRLHRFNIGR